MEARNQKIWNFELHTPIYNSAQTVFSNFLCWNSGWKSRRFCIQGRRNLHLWMTFQMPLQIFWRTTILGHKIFFILIPTTVTCVINEFFCSLSAIFCPAPPDPPSGIAKRRNPLAGLWSILSCSPDPTTNSETKNLNFYYFF